MVVDKRPEERGKLPGRSRHNSSPVSTAQSECVRATPKVFLILYGSNMGTAQELAQKLLQQASARSDSSDGSRAGFLCQALPKQTPVFVFCATYNGQPPDNASKFAAWLSQDLARYA
jgi:cytochrome P450/NADPH-cytochrome P450 reductase